MPRVRTIYGRKEVRYMALWLLDEEGRESAEQYLRRKGIINEDERLYSVEEKISERGGSSDGIPLCFRVAHV